MTRCPLCAWVVEPRQERAVTCGDCRVVYHADCWACLGTCAIFGCDFTRARVEGARPVLELDRRPALMLTSGALTAASALVSAAGWGVPGLFAHQGAALLTAVVTTWMAAVFGCMFLLGAVEQWRWARFPRERREGTVRAVRRERSTRVWDLELWVAGAGRVHARFNPADRVGAGYRVRPGDLFEASTRRLPGGGVYVEQIRILRPRPVAA